MNYCNRKGVECDCLSENSVCNSDNCHRKLPDKKLTDNEIVKAFEVLNSWQQVALQNDDGTDTESPKLYEAIEIVRKEINRLQAENERLKNSLAISKKETKRYKKGYKTANAEIERLKTAQFQFISNANADKKMTAKAEAYKEFWNKLKTHSRKMQLSDFSGEFWDKAVLVEDGDNLLKELVGE